MPINKLSAAQEKRFDEKVGTLVIRLTDKYGETSQYLNLLDNWEGLSKLIKQHLAEELARQKKQINNKWFKMMEKWGWKSGSDADTVISNFSMWAEDEIKKI